MSKIEITAVIDKSDIEPLGELRGATNSDAATLSGQEFQPGDVVFRGFAGTLDMAKGKYVGVYRFETATGDETTTMSIASLPDRGGEPSPKKSNTKRSTTEAESEISEDGI